MLKPIFILIFILTLFFPIKSVSLDKLICSRYPRRCGPDGRQTTTTPSPEAFLPDVIRDQRPQTFPEWEKYGTDPNNDDGTGYGSGVGPGYGPGLGDVAVHTGVGIAFPFGGLGIRRNFDLGFGGSGRIGGQVVGFGNGYAGNGQDASLVGWPKARPLSRGYWEPLLD